MMKSYSEFIFILMDDNINKLQVWKSKNVYLLQFVQIYSKMFSKTYTIHLQRSSGRTNSKIIQNQIHRYVI